MRESTLYLLTLLAALGSGLMAGVFFAFSTFVMQALAQLPPAQAIAAMQSINRTVLNPMFLGVFLGTALLCAALVIVALLGWPASAATVLAAALLYLAGTLLVTMFCNVPRNEALAQADPGSREAEQLWRSYLRNWTRWNHVRAGAALAATAGFMIALV
jgi:uncharacterized membrane protein